MAATGNRFGIQIDKGLSTTFEVEMAVASGTTLTIATGTPTKMSTAKAAPMVDGDGTTSQSFTGLAKDNSTETSSTAGTVQLWAPIPGIVYRAVAKTASLANTQALIDALIFKRVVYDLTAAIWSVDSAAADATTNSVVIVGGLPRTSELLFCYAVSGTVFGNPTT